MTYYKLYVKYQALPMDTIAPAMLSASTDTNPRLNDI